VKDDSVAAGSDVVLMPSVEPASANQLWYEDSATGVLRNAMNDYALTANSALYFVILHFVLLLFRIINTSIYA